VGRFRQFVTAWDNGFTIDAGAGIHLKVNNGMGLQMPSDAGAVYEQGWETTWSGTLPTNLQSWSEQLTQCPDRSWNSGDDKEPINCVTWIAVYAFCIWDGCGSSPARTIHSRIDHLTRRSRDFGCGRGAGTVASS
jgi:hypothetical protein